MNFNERNVFLFDGVGALLSSVFTGLILPLLFDWTGLTPSFLYSLALLPFIYSLYSLICYKFSKYIRPWMLKTIIMANLFYCLVSIVIIFIFPDITIWGRLLLAAEIVVILGVVVIEVKVLRKKFV